jgi:hypothetical protein
MTGPEALDRVAAPPCLESRNPDATDRGQADSNP